MPFYVMLVKERDRKSCLVETTLRQKSFSALVLNSGKSYYKAKRTKPTTIYLSGNHSQKLQRRPSIPKKKTSSTTRLSAKNEIVSLVALINYNCCPRRIHKRGLSTGHATSTYQQGSFCRMVRKENSCYVKGNFSSPLKKPCELFLYFKELL